MIIYIHIYIYIYICIQYIGLKEAWQASILPAARSFVVPWQFLPLLAWATDGPWTVPQNPHSSVKTPLKYCKE